MKTRDRALDLFKQAAIRADSESLLITMDSHLVGRAGSGMHIDKVMEAYECETEKALDQILREVAKLVEHRGRSWRREMSEIETALDEHMKRLRDQVVGQKMLAYEGPFLKLAHERLDECADTLRKRLDDFRDGWTSPRQPPWRQRNEVFYTVLMLVLGGVLTLTVEKAFELVNRSFLQEQGVAAHPENRRIGQPRS